MLKEENKEPQIEKDKMRRIRLMFDHLRSVFPNVHYPSKNLVIDESLVLWRGNISFRQYLPKKKHTTEIQTVNSHIANSAIR